MQNQMRSIHINSQQDMAMVATFLRKFSLALEQIDYGVVMENAAQVIGVCCKFKNVLKCFAVDPMYQGEGITTTLLGAVGAKAFKEGYDHTFVYTKPHNQTLFESLGFEVIVSTSSICLLEKGMPLIQETMEKIKCSYPFWEGEKAAIVMNGNPFTLGHQYLIELAAKQVKQLLVFVVEENVSAFTFSERLLLIQQGCAQFSNVLVIPSTSYIISQTTFPHYFLRDKEHAFDVYARIDATLFGTWFGPSLQITKRFVGEEPLDPMTQLYNEVLKEVLPQFGMEVIVVPRMLSGEEIISASKVRSLLKQGKFSEVKKFVPATTFSYLEQEEGLRERLQYYDKPH